MTRSWPEADPPRWRLDRSLVDGSLDASAEIGRVDRREAVELRFDLGEEAPQAGRLHVAAREQLMYVCDVLDMTPLELGERLGVEVEMPEREASLAGHERTALAPAVRERDEVGGGGELD